LPAAPPGGPWRAFWHLLQPVLAMLLLLGLVGAALGGVAVWLLRSAEGTAWLLARLPGLEVQGTEGALLSDAFAAERVVVRWDGGQQSVRIDKLRARGLQWSWHPARGAWVGLQAESITAQRVDIQTGPASPRPIRMPRSLQLPLLLQAQRAEVAELQIEALTPMTTVQADRVRLWQPVGAYQAEAVAFDWDRAHVDGKVSFGALPPYELQAQARLRARTAPGQPAAWTAEARAAGPLAAFELQATLRGPPAGKGAPPALDLDTSVTPLEAWPLGRLNLTTRALDLAALSSKAPQTGLSGRMAIDTRSYGGPVAATVELDNALPGSWDQGRLPLRRLQARLRSPDQDRARLLIEDFDLQLARGSESAGRWHGAGNWTGRGLQLDTTIEALRPQLLDSRAAVMQLSGTLAFTLTGLPSPDAAAAPVARKGLALTLRTQLDGTVEGSPHPVRLAIDASADANQVELHDLRAEAGSARATLALAARRTPGQTWQLRSSGTLSDFDPLPWWPGHEDSPWRNGPHRVSGSWAFDLMLPRLQPDLAVLTVAQGLAGSGTLHVERSLIAGVPVALHLELGRPGGATGAPSTVRGEVVLDGNRLSLEGQGQPLGDGRNDRLHFDLQAPALARLAPLSLLLPDLAGWVPRAGRADATLSLEGRWPDIRSEGQATLLAAQVGTLEARQAQARWRFDTASDQPLLLQAEAQGLVQAGRRLEQLTADLRGTWRQHRLELSAALPAQPPTGLQQVLGLRTAAGTLAQMRADGQWAGDGSGGGLWSGRIDQLRLGPWSGSATPVPAAPGSVWLDGRDLRAQVRFDASDGLSEVQAAAGRVRLAEALTLRWDEVRADLRGKATAFALRADIEPFVLAPLLARAQPSMGWSGDLRLAAQVDLKVGEKVDAELVFERRDGDLRLAEENASQPFGLSELKLVASAHDGNWQVGAAFAGKTLGEAAARLNLRPRPDQRWPTADTPIDGLIEGHVANLGVWGSWVPPGWRLSGELRTSASVGGRIGAPDYAGEVRASQVAVRNLLLGVDLRQGEALVRLKGARAEIERFTLQGGEGRLRVSGSARLDEEPSAALTLDAERFRVLGRVDRQLMASGRLQVDLSEAALAVNGQVQVDEGLFDLGRSDAPALDDDVTIRHASPDVETAAPTLPQRPRRRQQVAIAIDLGDRLRVRGRGLDTTLGGNLRLGSSAGRLTLNGIVNAAGGSYAAYGQKLDIERGLLIFSGDIEAPVLDVLALRPNLDMQVGVAITGSLYSPRVRLYSSSDMSESDKLSWLVLGRASEGLGRADTALLQRAAVALLAGEGEAPTDALLRNLGIDQLSLRQSDTDVRETVVSLGKQLSRRWYVGYERGVNATTGTWQLIYRIAQRFTLRAQSGLENSLDLIWVWRLQDPEPATPPMPKSPAGKPP
jgi:translocation and assembly module TamB